MADGWMFRHKNNLLAVADAASVGSSHLSLHPSVVQAVLASEAGMA